MKINLKFNGMPVLYKALNKKKEMEFQFTGQTLRELVAGLVRRFGKPIEKALLDSSGDIDMEIRVVRNGTTYLSENRMETALNEGDTIAFMGAS